MYLPKKELRELISAENLIIRPLLCEKTQVGEFTIDFRLGTDFLVSTLNREPFVDATYSTKEKKSVKSFFKPTRRKFGQDFILYPNQTVLCNSLEYVKLPSNVFATLNMRSSFGRLGLTLSTLIQAGYCGCLPIELTNHNQNPIKLAVGARIFQARFCYLTEDTDYDYKNRKYVCQVRPEVAKFEQDDELKYLKDIALK